MILDIGDPKNSTRKCLEMINKLSNVARYRINLYKSIAFRYTDNKHTEKEIMDILPFTMASKKIKHLGIYPTQEMKSLCNGNLKLLKR